jgi:hypothetical protein
VTPAGTQRVLMIAFHYPPQRGSSGIQRTLKFSQYLPRFGWQPLVLTAHPRAHANISHDQLVEIPASVPVASAFALDAARHLAIRGRYMLAWALPDRWSTWWLGALPAAFKMIRTYRPQVIWSTYPIATAQLIGYTVHRFSGLPWIADFRDPMVDAELPSHPRVRRLYQWIEAKAVKHCAMLIFSTPGAVADYRQRYPAADGSRFRLIENCYYEENFSAAEINARQAQQITPKRPGCIRLLHSGIIYPSERDPRPFFAALLTLLQQGKITPPRLQIILRATANDAYLTSLIEQYGIASLVSLQPPISYQRALTEMLEADGLLILQASNCNIQIPAKLYEYLRAQRPILALTDPTGDTADKLRSCGITTIAKLDCQQDIQNVLMNFLSLVEAGCAPVASTDYIVSQSRLARSRELGALLDEVGAVQ